VIVGHGRSDDGAVVLVFADAQRQPFAHRRLGDGHQQGVVGLRLARPPDEQRQSAGLEHGLGYGDGALRRIGLAVGVGQAQRQHQGIGPGVFGGFGPRCRVVGGVAPRFQQQRRPVRRALVHDLDGHSRPVRDVALEEHERQGAFAADGQSAGARAALLVGRAERHFTHLAGPLLLDDLRLGLGAQPGLVGRQRLLGRGSGLGRRDGSLGLDRLGG